MTKNNKETFGTIVVNQEEGEALASQYGMTLVDNCFVLGTKTDK